MTTKPPVMKRKDLTFSQGYVCAVAEIIRTHGDTVIARDVLKGAGDVEWHSIDRYDRETLAEVGLLPRARRP